MLADVSLLNFRRGSHHWSRGGVWGDVGNVGSRSCVEKTSDMVFSYVQWEFQDPIDGGTLVPYFWPYFVGIFPEIKA